jgi:hypothetical protein
MSSDLRGCSDAEIRVPRLRGRGAAVLRDGQLDPTSSIHESAGVSADVHRTQLDRARMRRAPRGHSISPELGRNARGHRSR